MTKEKLVKFFESLDENTNLDKFKDIYATGVHFKDPFHEVYDVTAVYQIFQQMYNRLDSPRFKIIEYIREENVAYIKWRFIFRFKGEVSVQTFVGVSRLCINKQAKISEHIDFWDAGEHIYEKLPVLGSFIRWIKKKIQKA